MAGRLAAGLLKNHVLVGQVVTSNLQNALKVQVPYFEFDERLKAFFKKTEDLIVTDPSNSCKTGDVVVLKKLEKQFKKEITHVVADTIFKCGDVQDPISGKMVVGNQYRELQSQIEELYGTNKNFNYEEAPERGRFEGTRDFTDKPVYRYRYYKELVYLGSKVILICKYTFWKISPIPTQICSSVLT